MTRSESDDDKKQEWKTEVCKRCKGTGTTPNGMCENCGGTGQIHIPDEQ